MFDTDITDAELADIQRQIDEDADRMTWALDDPRWDFVEATLAWGRQLQG